MKINLLNNVYGSVSIHGWCKASSGRLYHTLTVHGLDGEKAAIRLPDDDFRSFVATLNKFAANTPKFNVGDEVYLLNKTRFLIMSDTISDVHMPSNPSQDITYVAEKNCILHKWMYDIFATKEEALQSAIAELTADL